MSQKFHFGSKEKAEDKVAMKRRLDEEVAAYLLKGGKITRVGRSAHTPPPPGPNSGHKKVAERAQRFQEKFPHLSSPPKEESADEQPPF